MEIIDTTPENVHLFGQCGYKNLKHEGYRRKLEWLKERNAEGMKHKILLSEKDGAVGGIEYAPGEKIWRGIDARDYLVIQCLYVIGKAYKGEGNGLMLLRECIAGARQQGFGGVAVVTRRGTWMVGKEVFLQEGFEVVDQADPDFKLMVRKFNRHTPNPCFKCDYEEKLQQYKNGLTIITSAQCPFLGKAVPEIIDTACELFSLEPSVIELSTAEQAQNIPTPYGSFCIIYNGRILIDAPCSKTKFRNDMRKILK